MTNILLRISGSLLHLRGDSPLQGLDDCRGSQVEVRVRNCAAVQIGVESSFLLLSKKIHVRKEPSFEMPRELSTLSEPEISVGNESELKKEREAEDKDEDQITIVECKDEVVVATDVRTFLFILNSGKKINQG